MKYVSNDGKMFNTADECKAYEGTMDAMYDENCTPTLDADEAMYIHKNGTWYIFDIIKEDWIHVDDVRTLATYYDTLINFYGTNAFTQKTLAPIAEFYDTCLADIKKMS